MSYTPQQLWAIAWYAKREGLVPQLSAWPIVRFKRTSEQMWVEEGISNLVDWYSAHLKELTRARGQKRREEAKANAARKSLEKRIDDLKRLSS